MTPGAQNDILDCLCALMNFLPSGASNLARFILASGSNRSLPSVNEIFLTTPQYRFGTLIVCLFCLRALALHCYQPVQPRVVEFFFYDEYPHPLWPTAQQRLGSYKVRASVATRSVLKHSVHIRPSQLMTVPISKTIPELRYDNAGNAYARDISGIWQPHPGIAQAVTQSEDRYMSQAYDVSFNHSLSFVTCTYHFLATCSGTLYVSTHNSCELLPTLLVAITITVWIPPPTTSRIPVPC